MMKNNVRAKVQRMEYLADIIDVLIDARNQRTSEYYKNMDTDEWGYRDYNPDDWGNEYCEEKLRLRAAFDEAIKAVEKLADK